MKEAVAICPEKRPGLDELCDELPLVLEVYLGRPFLDHALDGFARQGCKAVTLLVSDRPAEVRHFVGNGSTWGLSVKVVSTSSEMTVEEARDRDDVRSEDQVVLLEALPQAPSVPILRNARSWQGSRPELLSQLAPRQLGTREIAPGVWAGLKTRIAASARLEAPTWIGHNVHIGPNTIIGPNAFVENDSLVDHHATVRNSTVGARTFLGSLTNLENSVASGPVLINWQNDSLTRLRDAFLLSRMTARREAAESPVKRLLALLILLVTLPVPVLALVLAPFLRRPWCVSRAAVTASDPGEPAGQVSYREFPGLPGGWSRWPRLWRIVTGQFAWIGNPPVSPEEAATLESEFDRLWLHAPPALFTAPEAEGCSPPWNDEARAHAALFASQPTSAWCRRIIAQGLLSLVSKKNLTKP